MRSVSSALLAVHRVLIDVVATQRDPFRAVVGDPVGLFQLVLNEPEFAWLRPMLQLVAQIDELTELPDAPTDDEAKVLRARIERMLAPNDDPDGFGSRYVALLPLEPELAMAHADLRFALRALPDG